MKRFTEGTAMNFVIDALAVYRLTRLATRDEITEGLRETIEKELGTAVDAKLVTQKTGEKLVYMLRCDWCMSIWVALFALILKKYVPDLWNNLRYVLAASAATGMIATYE